MYEFSYFALQSSALVWKWATAWNIVSTMILDIQKILD